MALPLDGVRILDFSRYQQGPYATVMLGDLGAEVWKVEDPGAGDFGRRMWREKNGYSGFWESLNRGKRSICLDLRRPEGVSAALDLSASCDIVVENFRPGVMAGWGLDYEAFRTRNPRIIYAQATGWGTEGPMATEPSFDQIAQAHSGFALHSGGGPGHRPEIPFPGVADQTGAMNLAFAMMTALYVRERTGIAQRVEVSLYGTQLALQATELQHALYFGEERPRELRASPTVGQYQCSDGKWIMIVGIDQKFWPRLCSALGLSPEIEAHERYARGFGRWSNRAELEPIIEDAFARQPSDHWMARLRDADHPATVVREYAEVAEDPQALANGYIVEQDHPKFGRSKVLGLHIKLDETPGRVGAAAPELGADTVAVLQLAGLSEARIQALLDSGVAAQS
ncbi:MAG: CaiB/BaiF CoA transferase family protein [Dehalococcoidia bacterium]